jgi:GST-like protein
VIELYAMVSPNVQKIYLMLEECDLDYRAHQVNIWKGEQFASDFRALNPNSKVPVIVDHTPFGGGTQTIFESGAILIYLSEKTSRFLPSSGSTRYEVLQWLMIQLTGIGPMFGQFNHFRRFASDNAYGVSRYTTQAATLYRLIDDRLSQHNFLGGDDYSIADIATFPWLRNQASRFNEAQSFMRAGNPDYPHLWRWFDGIAARAAVQRALQVIDSHPSTLPTSTPDEMDRVFGRGRYAASPDAWGMNVTSTSSL